MMWYHRLEVWWFMIVPALAFIALVVCWAYADWAERRERAEHRRQVEADAVTERQRRTVIVKAWRQAVVDRHTLAPYDREMDEYLTEEGLT